MIHRNNVRVFTIVITCLLVIFLSGLIVGAQASEAETAALGSLKALTYSYGSFHGGEWNYSITRETEGLTDENSPQYHFIAKGFNGVEMDVEGSFGQALMDQLESIIDVHDILSWNGFHERDAQVLDGYGFTLTAEFDNGILSASGYEKYPANYQTAHGFLSSCLHAWATNSFFVGDTPDETSVFSYAGRSTVEFAKNFERDFPTSVTVADLTVASGEPFTSVDPSLIRQVFEALKGITILDGRQPAHTDDYTESTFIMADERRFTFTFQQGCFLIGEMQAEVTGYDQLEAARNAVFTAGE